MSGAFRRWAILAPVLPLIAVAGGSYLWKRPNPAPPPAKPTLRDQGLVIPEGAPQWRYIERATAAESAPIPPLPVPGRVAFDEKRTAAVASPLPGRIEQVRVRIGDEVRAGTRLFSVRSGNFAEMRRDLAGAEASVHVKRQVVERTRELVQLRATPEKELLQGEAELREAELSSRTARARLGTLRAAPAGESLFWVTAPRQGTVVELDLFANQQVSPDRDQPLCRISDLDEVLVLADVQESEIPNVRPASLVTVRTQTQATRVGRVDHVSSVVDSVRRTVEVRVRVENHDRKFRAHAFVDVSLSVDPNARTIRVPTDAVVTAQGRPLVFVIRGSGQIEQVAVTTGSQRDGQIEILRGLEVGTVYVARGALLLLNELEFVR